MGLGDKILVVDETTCQIDHTVCKGYALNATFFKQIRQPFTSNKKDKIQSKSVHIKSTVCKSNSAKSLVKILNQIYALKIVKLLQDKLKLKNSSRNLTILELSEDHKIAVCFSKIISPGFKRYF